MIRKRASKVAVATVALMSVAGPAMAAGTYNFTANFKYRLNSGSWSQGAGTTKYFFHCTSGSGQTYSVTLYKENLFADTNMGSKTFTCNSTDDTGSWSGLNSDSYHFTLTKPDNGVYVVGSGYITYP